ncbi:MAG: hypothetical protein H7138_21040 [Myxococcales bacterium]|nr:hypothetical protein [Myxococcales bacterium]
MSRSPGDVYNPAGIMLVNLRALLGVIIDIVLLRRGPDSLPASPALLAIVVGVYAAVMGLVASWFATPEQHWPLELGAGIALVLLWYRVALTLAGKRERFVQMMTALFSAHLLIRPLTVPMQSTLLAQAQTPSASPSSGLALIFLILLVWLFVITVRVVRSTFEWPTAGAIILVLAQELTMITIIVLLLSGSVPAT